MFTLSHIRIYDHIIRNMFICLSIQLTCLSSNGKNDGLKLQTQYCWAMCAVCVLLNLEIGHNLGLNRNNIGFLHRKSHDSFMDFSCSWRVYTDTWNRQIECGECFGTFHRIFITRQVKKTNQIQLKPILCHYIGNKW